VRINCRVWGLGCRIYARLGGEREGVWTLCPETQIWRKGGHVRESLNLKPLISCPETSLSLQVGRVPQTRFGVMLGLVERARGLRRQFETEAKDHREALENLKASRDEAKKLSEEKQVWP
jgi:hypothetical protein